MNPLDVYMGFMFPIVMKVNIMVLNEMTPNFSADGYRLLGATCFHFYPEEGISMSSKLCCLLTKLRGVLSQKNGLKFFGLTLYYAKYIFFFKFVNRTLTTFGIQN
jgi:hypothetical protein